MNTCIKKVRDWFDAHSKAKEWAWLVVLWCGGLLTVIAVAYPIKWLIKSM